MLMTKTKLNVSFTIIITVTNRIQQQGIKHITLLIAIFHRTLSKGMLYKIKLGQQEEIDVNIIYIYFL